MMTMCNPPIVANNLCVVESISCTTHTVRYPQHLNDAEWCRRVDGIAQKLNLSFEDASKEFRTKRWAGLNYERRPQSICTMNKCCWHMGFCSESCINCNG